MVAAGTTSTYVLAGKLNAPPGGGRRLHVLVLRVTRTAEAPILLRASRPQRCQCRFSVTPP